MAGQARDKRNKLLNHLRKAEGVEICTQYDLNPYEKKNNKQTNQQNKQTNPAKVWPGP